MNTHTLQFKIKLGMFIFGGALLFIVAIYLIGKQKNLFDPVFKMTTTFYNVSGLQIGNNVRFSGINVGTVDNIIILNDSTVQVDMLIKTSVQKFIRADCVAGIGSEGIIGDKVLIISQGSHNAPLPKDGQRIISNEPVELDAIMSSLQITADNTVTVSEQVAEIVTKINNSSGTLWRLIEDSTMAKNISQTIVSLEKSSKGLNENMNAAKENILLRGYFNRKRRAAQKVVDDASEKQIEEQKDTNKEDTNKGD